VDNLAFRDADNEFEPNGWRSYRSDQKLEVARAELEESEELARSRGIAWEASVARDQRDARPGADLGTGRARGAEPPARLVVLDVVIVSSGTRG